MDGFDVLFFGIVFIAFAAFLVAVVSFATEDPKVPYNGEMLYCSDAEHMWWELSEKGLNEKALVLDKIIDEECD